MRKKSSSRHLGSLTRDDVRCSHRNSVLCTCPERCMFFPDKCVSDNHSCEWLRICPLLPEGVAVYGAWCALLPSCPPPTSRGSRLSRGTADTAHLMSPPPPPQLQCCRNALLSSGGDKVFLKSFKLELTRTYCSRGNLHTVRCCLHVEVSSLC